MIVNIRGANGSGKSTAARFFIPPNAVSVDLAPYKTPKGTPRTVVGQLDEAHSVATVGSYATACGGLDQVPNFDLMRLSITMASAQANHVIAEGVLASTVYSSWAQYASQMKRDCYIDFVFAYLRVPLAECLRRIQIRNGGKPIKEHLVAHKISAIEGTRKKAIAADFRVYDLPLGFNEAGPAIWEIMNETGERYRVRN